MWPALDCSYSVEREWESQALLVSGRERESEGRRKGVRAELPWLHLWYLLQCLSLECALAGSREGSHTASGQCARIWKKHGSSWGDFGALGDDFGSILV